MCCNFTHQWTVHLPAVLNSWREIRGRRTQKASAAEPTAGWGIHQLDFYCYCCFAFRTLLPPWEPPPSPPQSGEAKPSSSCPARANREAMVKLEIAKVPIHQIVNRFYFFHGRDDLQGRWFFVTLISIFVVLIYLGAIHSSSGLGDWDSDTLAWKYRSPFFLKKKGRLLSFCLCCIHDFHPKIAARLLFFCHCSIHAFHPKIAARPFLLSHVYKSYECAPQLGTWCVCVL